MRDTLGVRRETCIGREAGRARGSAEALELGVVADREHQVAIGRGERLYGTMFGWAVPWRVGGWPVTR